LKWRPRHRAVIQRVDVFRLHIKPEWTRLFFCFADLQHDFANANKGVHQASGYFVSSLHFSSEGTLEKIEDRRSLRGKQARSHMTQPHTDIVGAVASRDEPVVPEGILHKCGAFTVTAYPPVHPRRGHRG
jgi:hypothetical protein